MPSGPVVTPAGPLAQSIPLAPYPSFLPPPDQVAPCLFNVHIPFANSYPPSGAANFYNYNTVPYYPWAPPPAPPPPMPPATQPVPQQPPQPQNNQAPDTPPAPGGPVPEPSQVRDGLPLTPELVEMINSNLESPDYTIRQQAAVKLAHVLEGDPNILSKPQLRPYAEALILKVLRDPNSLVRQPLLVTMELGNLNSPTPAIISALVRLKQERGLYNFEPGHIDSVLRQFKYQEAAARRQQAQQPNAALQLAQQQHRMPPPAQPAGVPGVQSVVQGPGRRVPPGGGLQMPGGPANVAPLPGGIPRGAVGSSPGQAGNVAPFPGMPPGVMQMPPQRRLSHV